MKYYFNFKGITIKFNKMELIINNSADYRTNRVFAGCPLESNTILSTRLVKSGTICTYLVELSNSSGSTTITFNTESPDGKNLNTSLYYFCDNGNHTEFLIEFFISVLGFVPIRTSKYPSYIKFRDMEDYCSRRKTPTMTNFMGTTIPKAYIEHMHTAASLKSDTGGDLNIEDFPENMQPYVCNAIKALNKDHTFTPEELAVYDFLGLLDTLKQEMFIHGDQLLLMTPYNILNTGSTIHNIHRTPSVLNNMSRNIRSISLINGNVIKLLEPYRRLERDYRYGDELDYIAMLHFINDKLKKEGKSVKDLLENL